MDANRKFGGKPDRIDGGFRNGGGAGTHAGAYKLCGWTGELSIHRAEPDAGGVATVV